MLLRQSFKTETRVMVACVGVKDRELERMSWFGRQECPNVPFLLGWDSRSLLFLFDCRDFADLEFQSMVVMWLSFSRSPQDTCVYLGLSIGTTSIVFNSGACHQPFGRWAPSSPSSSLSEQQRQSQTSVEILSHASHMSNHVNRGRDTEGICRHSNQFPRGAERKCQTTKCPQTAVLTPVPPRIKGTWTTTNWKVSVYSWRTYTFWTDWMCQASRVASIRG